MKYSSSVNNYRETPYIVSDTFANKGNYTATIKGAIFICRDGASLNEPSIYQANGTTWVAIGGYGIGTDATLEDVTTNGNTTDKGISITAGGLSTNSLTDTGLTAKSIPFVGTAGLITEDNTNFVWDNVNKWIGIQTNVPTAEVDIHTTTATPAIVINNTAALASRIGFQNTNVSKWTIGNSVTNTFNFYNSVLASIAAYLDGANNSATFNGSVQALSSGGNRDTTVRFNGSVVDAGTYAAVQAIAKFSNNGSGNITKLILSDIVNADCAITFQPNATIANSIFGIGINAAAPQFALLGSGNVGINTTSISQPSAGATTLRILGGVTTKAGAIVLDSSDSSVSAYIYPDNTSGLSINTSTSHPITLRTNGTTRATIAATTGNFLLGSAVDNTVNKLQVTGSIQSSTIVYAGNSTTDRTQISNERLLQYSSNYYIYGLINDSNDLSIESAFSGNIKFRAQAQGTSSVPNTATVRMTVGSNGDITIANLAGTGSRAVLASATGILSAPVSDQSVKENVQPLQYGLDTLMQLKPVQFEYINKYKDYGEGLQIGNIAQDVEKIIPEAVFVTPLTGLKGIDYNQFNGIYIKAIQDQQKIIEGLIERIEQLEKKY